MEKREFRRRLERAGERARALAVRYVVEDLPTKMLYILPEYDDPRGNRGPAGTVKYFGGRFLRPDELKLVSSNRAADLLWVDGRVPAWVDVIVSGVDDDATHIHFICSQKLQIADESTLPRDLPRAVDPDDPIEPFRIRGPFLPQGWRSVEQYGRIRLRRTRDPG